MAVIRIGALGLTYLGIFPLTSTKVRPNQRTDCETRIFTEKQIIGTLAEHEAGAKNADLSRENGMSEGTFYNWKSRFDGMTVSEAKRLRALEDESAKWKKLIAEQMINLATMKELLSKKW